MNTASTSFDVILLGFHQIQRTIIKSLCAMSHKRERSYNIIGSGDLFAADVILIDLQDHMVIQNWDQLKDVLGGIPVLLVGDDPVDDGFAARLKRNEISSSLLDTLDLLTSSSATPDIVEEIIISGISDDQELDDLEIENEAVEVQIDELSSESDLSDDELASFGFVGADEPEPEFDFGHIDLNNLEENTIVLSGGIVGEGGEESLEDAAGKTNEESALIPDAIVSKVDDKVIADRLKRFHHISIVADAERRSENRILVVDDSRTVWAQMRACLKGIDADVDFIQTAEGGIDQIAERDYSLVFMDVVLPGIDGYTACQRIKANQASSHIPVIMLTTASTPANKVRGVLAGCSFYLTKPANMKEVQTVVNRYMGQDTCALGVSNGV